MPDGQGCAHLNEHNVPYLQDIGVVHVDQMGSISAANAVVVDLTAGSAGADIAHLPEVVLAAEGQHPGRRQQLQPAADSLYVSDLKVRHSIFRTLQSHFIAGTAAQPLPKEA